jgi:integrase
MITCSYASTWVRRAASRPTASNGVAEKAGVTAYSPHKVRHTGGTQKARNGAPGWVVQAALRHSRLSTTQIYIDMDGPETARKAAQYAASTLLDAEPAATKRTPRAPKPRKAA